MKSIAILGRQPALGTAELESLFGADKITKIPGGALLIDIPAGEIPFNRLGGVIKLGSVLKKLNTTNWRDIESYLVPACQEHSEYLSDGKLTIGLSAYGINISPKQLESTALAIKKAVKSTGRPVRIVPNKGLEISTPQILHNKLTHENGWELVLYRDGNSTILARTNYVQDIEAYTARDQARPMRDSRVGMLPPKLAQIIINLAVGELELKSRDPGSEVILDPFCGSGVILQESLLMGYTANGTDIEPRMIEYSKVNLEWLAKNLRLTTYDLRLSQADAISHQWDILTTSDMPHTSVAVACEAYLGLPFAHLPSDKQLQESVQSSNTIIKGFLKNLATQTKPGFRGCVAMPAWHTKNKVVHLPCLGQLETIGWKRVTFKHIRNDDLIYRREDQIVGRELVVISRI